MATAIIVIAAVVVIVGFTLLVLSRKQRDRQVIDLRRREFEGHRQEAEAHQQRASEVTSEAARKRDEADRLEAEIKRLQAELVNRREEAVALEQRGERSLRFARRHEGAAEQNHDEIERRSKAFRVR